MAIPATRLLLAIVIVVASSWPWGAGADDHPGAAIYREHCLRCHGENGIGTPVAPAPLVGDRSVGQLTRYVADTMPEDDPEAVTGEAAARVAEWIHDRFYSAVARDRHRPPRVELARLTVGQHRNAIADLVSGFLPPSPAPSPERGLRAEYFQGRDFNPARRVFERIDPSVGFDFGVEGPDPERFEPGRFAIRWQGSIVPDDSGPHEFIVRTEHAVRLLVNHADWEGPPVIDAWVKSGDDSEYRGTVHLLAGRPHPLRLEFSKASQGVDNPLHERPRRASIELLWRQPDGVVERVPERNLIPRQSPPTFVVTTPFPPDDRSIGYERGSTVSKEWLAAVEATAVESASNIRARAGRLVGVKQDAPDRTDRLRGFARTVAERAFRRPLDPPLQALVERPFDELSDPDAALERSLLLVLSSPRFLFREPPTPTEPTLVPWDTAARLSFGVWDSLPDESLRTAAARGELATPDQIETHVRRMLGDRRAGAKLRSFLLAWLRVDKPAEIAKDATRHPGFDAAVVHDLRTSLRLLLDGILFPADGRADYRRLFTTDDVALNGRLAAIYGVDLPARSDFVPVRLDEGRRAGVLTHPYLMSLLAYPGESSPIHRGVFLTRGILGNVLKAPAEAVAPLAPDLHPGLSTRERVTLQTSPAACQGCHAVINPLGFALEDFDAVGRFRGDGGGDAAGSYVPREGPEVTFVGAEGLAGYLVASVDAEEAFLQALFHALVRQPIRAWGPETLPRLRRSFAAKDFDIHEAVVDIMKVAVLPPRQPLPEENDDHAP